MSDTRERLSERVTAERLRLEARRASRGTFFTLFGFAIGIACAAYLITNISQTMFKSTRVVQVAVDDATGVIATKTQVRFKGIKAGTVTKVERENGQSVLTLKLQDKYGPIYRNASAELRPNTPLQDMSVDVTDRGTKDAGLLGEDEPLPRSRTRTAVNVSEVLNVFDDSTRARLVTLLDELGHGLDHNGAALRAAFAEFVPFVDMAGKITKKLNARAGKVRRLVSNFATLSESLAERDATLRRLMADGSATLGVLQSSAPQVDATLAALPGTIRELDASFAALHGVLPPTDAAVEALGPVAEELPAALKDLRALAVAASPAVTKLQEPVQRLQPTAKVLEPVGEDLLSSLRRLEPQIPSVDKVTRNLKNCERGVQGFWIWNTSLTKFADARSPLPRGNAVIEPSAVGINTPDEFAVPSCTPGEPVGGRPPREEDKR